MPKNKNEMPQPAPQRPRGFLVLLLLFLSLLLFTFWMAGPDRAQTVAWTEFLELIREGQVLKIEQRKEAIRAEMVKGAEHGHITVYYPGAERNEADVQTMNEAIDDYKHATGQQIPIKGEKPPSGLTGLVLQFVFFGLLFVLLYFMFFRRMGQGGGVLSFGKSRAQLVSKGKTGRTFKDVAGVEEAKEEVSELVTFLKEPDKFHKIGARIPRGVLMVGPPGTGKTLLAKAIAGEADVPFYSISGSDFVEMFVGVGASRVRDLFNQAKDNSPCIIFIDEIDAVARRRGGGMSSGGHDEREQTLNAILVEMDGFASDDKVIVIAATNRVDVLDPALTRPGRFDRHVQVELPDVNGREEILAVHAQKVKLGDGVDLSVIARGTPGFSGADLESLINEAALHAARKDRKAIINRDMEYARDRVAFGREKKGRSRSMPLDEKRLTAYHEAGHAVIQMLLPECDPLHKVSIIPRGRALGVTIGLPRERYSHNTERLRSEMALLYGGRVAEDRFCSDITTGASNDIQRATQLARGMVYEWGMSEKMGPIKYTEEHEGISGSESHIAVSEQTRRELDEEVRKIIERSYKHAEELIDANSDSVARVAEALLEWETLDAIQVEKLMAGEDLGPRPRAKITTVSEAAEKQDQAAEEPTASAKDNPDDETGLQPSLA